MLSSVTVNKFPNATGTYGTITTNGTHDMGSTNNYRYVGVSVTSSIGFSFFTHGSNVRAQNYNSHSGKKLLAIHVTYSDRHELSVVFPRSGGKQGLDFLGDISVTWYSDTNYTLTTGSYAFVYGVMEIYDNR